MRREFRVHMLTEDGKTKAREIAQTFSTALDRLELLCGADGREMSIVRTKMEEAAFFAKKSMAERNSIDEFAPAVAADDTAPAPGGPSDGEPCPDHPGAEQGANGCKEPGCTFSAT